MALVKCPACNTEVSDQAVSCPKCGHPFRNTTVELTNKRWKLLKLLAWVFLVLGLYALASGFPNGGWNNPLTGLGFSTIFVGFIFIIVGKLGAWWTNK
jgi:hypothetical protein